jgi:hypothetical protein
MATLPSECPKCGKPIKDAYMSRGGAFSADIEMPAYCSGAFAWDHPSGEPCDWENRFPHVCAHCGGYRWEDADPNPQTVGGRTFIRVAQACADCGEPSEV